MIRTEIDSMPQELDAITRRVMQLEIEEAALKKENDAASKERLEALRKELADLRAQADAMTAQWEAERQAIRKLQALREELEQVRREIEEAERDYDLNRAAELRHGRLPELERRLAGRGGAPRARSRATTRLLREEVTEDEIAEVVARWTGIPVAPADGGRAREAAAPRRGAARARDRPGRGRPAGRRRGRSARARASRTRGGRSARSSSSGRPASARPSCPRALAEALFDSEDNIVRLDMSEYQERHTVSRLMGAPPGYVGYEEGGQLTEAVRRKPYSVVLFDEIEKAHPDVFNTLLQILDDGRLTDAQGRTVDFRNTVIIMTSNIGSAHLLEGLAATGEIREDARERVMAELRAHFRPEFLNRVDEIVLFKPLTLEEIEQIVDLQIADLAERLADRRLTLELTEPARAADRAPGLRPGLRRAPAAPLHPARGRDAHRAGADRGRHPRRRRRSRSTPKTTSSSCAGRTPASSRQSRPRNPSRHNHAIRQPRCHVRRRDTRAAARDAGSLRRVPAPQPRADRGPGSTWDASYDDRGRDHLPRR